MAAAPLLAWFARAARDLPWRVEPRDPYAVWVSEVMLQQTRVETVVRYHRRFLARFPTVHALAAAHEDDVMKAWEGLGYYRRARLLHRGARHVAAHGWPRSRDEWLAVPGVGEYTAGAIASLTRGEPVAAVDGNVLRVFSRVARFEADATTPAARAAATRFVLRHQPPQAAGAFNEALMELGATVCLPRAPRCDACPWGDACAGRDVAASLPAKPAKAPPRAVRVSLAVVRRGDLWLLEKRERGLLAGTWGLPWVEGGPAALARKVAALTGGAATVGREVAEASHAFTHRRWAMRAFEVAARGRGGEWRGPGEVALATAHRRILRLLVEA